MQGKPPLAHSPRHRVPAQTYIEHITNVRQQANRNARRAAAFHKGDCASFIGSVDAAAIYHDLGKLEKSNQEVLERDSRDPLPIRHEDAGVAELERLGRQEAAVLVAAHHAGLFSCAEEIAKQGLPFRYLDIANQTNANLPALQYVHAFSGCPEINQIPATALHDCGFTRRVALSCLVDADHSDTSRNYGREVQTPRVKRRWSRRLDALKQYVNNLPQGKGDREIARNALRRRVFDACTNVSVTPSIRACDAPVGSGKTTAVMAHMLKVAVEKRLRHIFVVLPYTNIIS